MKKLKLNKQTISLLGNDNQKEIIGGENNITVSPCTDSILRNCGSMGPSHCISQCPDCHHSVNPTACIYTCNSDC